MKNFLLFLSLCIGAIQFTFGQEPTADSLNTGPTRKYKFELTTSKAAISGILITQETQNEIVGSMINDFGLSALEFKFNKKTGKIKLLNVAQFLNKWYIKLVLKKDIAVCIRRLYNLESKESKNYIILDDSQDLTVVNKKRNLKYQFSPLQIQGKEDET
ncbi:MAG: hypothetical protein K2M87_06805 [Muribaculaceae bacterium]|nr:hypothetical protein [Muribaculaceae bacterium]